MKLSFCLFLSMLLFSSANIEVGNRPPDYESEFSSIIVRTSKRLQHVAARRALKIKAMNDSLASTAEAVKLMASKGDNRDIIALLDRAHEDYEPNSFSLLLKGIFYNAQGQEKQATQWFEAFLMESRTYTDFEKAFIRWDDFHRLRRIVFEMLKARGVSFEGRAEDIQVRVPFRALMEYIRDPSPSDRKLNIAFIAVIFGGILLLFAAAMMGADFSGYWMQTVVYLYVGVWISYGLWLGDLAFGLPGKLDRFSAIPLFLGVLVSARLTFGGYLWWSELHRPLEEGYRRCPHCGAVVEKLMIECSECRQKIEP